MSDLEHYITLKNHIESALREGEICRSKIDNDIVTMEGMTGTKTRNFYNNLLTLPDARYLEIGTWKGSSVCSAMYNNTANIVCIDNFCTFGGPRDELLNNIDKYRGNNTVRFIESDCFKVDVSSLPKFNIYMFDGEHTYEDQYNALVHYYNCLDDMFIFMADDWNYESVRNGTRDAISHLKLNNLYEKEIFTGYSGDADGWWNGLGIMILSKSK